MKMTKIKAIEQVLSDHGGIADLRAIYDNIGKYYPAATQSKTWLAGIRGTINREIIAGKNFKRIGLSRYALKHYEEETLPRKTEKVRMHSFIEGICLEIGNFKNYLTYTADPAALFRENIKLKDLTTIKELPDFSYSDIVSEVKKIDVIWLNKIGQQFPQKVFEVVDSVGTLTSAFNRSMQLLNFRTECYIVAPEQHRKRFDKQIRLAPYNSSFDKFKFVDYDKMIALYQNAVETNRLEESVFDF